MNNTKAIRIIKAQEWKQYTTSGLFDHIDNSILIASKKGEHYIDFFLNEYKQIPEHIAESSSNSLKILQSLRKRYEGIGFRCKVDFCDFDQKKKLNISWFKELTKGNNNV